MLTAGCQPGIMPHYSEHASVIQGTDQQYAIGVCHNCFAVHTECVLWRQLILPILVQGNSVLEMEEVLEVEALTPAKLL
jgi:hypothetical protein